MLVARLRFQRRAHRHRFTFTYRLEANCTIRNVRAESIARKFRENGPQRLSASRWDVLAGRALWALLRRRAGR